MVTKAYLLRRNIHPDVWKLLHSKRHRHHVLKSLHKGLLGHDPCGGCGSELCETEGDRIIRSVLTFELILLNGNNWEKVVKFYYQSPTIVQWTWLTCWYRFSNWLTVNCSGKTTSCMTGGGSGLGERNTFNSCMKKKFQ